MQSIEADVQHDQELSDLKQDGSLNEGASLAGPSYRLYPVRFYGLVALILLNIACALNWFLFSAISYDTASHFGITTTQVTWLANCVCIMYLPTAPLAPWMVRRVGLSGTIRTSGILLILGAWLRYAAIAPHTSSGQLALLVVGSLIVGVAQCLAQVVVPSYSETWFDLKNRTTMTMLCAVSNPLGGAVASLVGPATSIAELLLAVAIASTAVGLFASFLPQRPPTAPSPSADSRVELSFFASIARLRLLKMRDRIDFAILAFVFTIVVAFFDAFLTLTNIIFEPEGYSSDQAGYIGAAVIGAGLVGAIVTAPILDRPLRHHFATVAKVILPVIGACFLAFIWVTRPNRLGGLLALGVIMGATSFTLLPVALELAAEVTFETGLGPEWSSSVMYWGANGFSVVTVSTMTALEDKNPPYSMRRALVYQGVFVMATCLLAFLVRGKQYRKELDERRRISQLSQ